jgi:hypothetical protein
MIIGIFRSTKCIEVVEKAAGQRCEELKRG